MRSSVLAAILLALLAAPALAQGAVAADGVVAAIGYAIVPRSVLAAYQPAFAPGRSAADALQQLIDDRLLAIEARRYAIAPEKGELNASRAKHELPAGFAPSEWDEVLLARILAKRFLDFRFGDFVPIPREAIQAHIQAHPARFKGSAEANEAQARAELLPAERAKREEAFLVELRVRGGARIVPGVL